LAKNLTSVVLAQPSTDPSIDVGQSFTMEVYGGYSGGGAVSSHDFYLEWDQGTSTWEQIPESDTGAGLYSTSQTDYTGLTTAYENPPTFSITVYGNKAGSYEIRAHGVRGINNFYDPSPTQTVTVNAAGGQIDFSAAIVAASSTPETVDLSAGRSFSADIIAASSTPETVDLSAGRC
jgi:hypothetical protein